MYDRAIFDGVWRYYDVIRIFELEFISIPYIVFLFHYWQFLDDNKDNMINFKEFMYVLGVVCKGDITQKLKLLYLLHQLSPHELEDMASPSPTSPASSKTGTKIS